MIRTHVRSLRRILLPAAAVLGLAVALGGCVAYPAYPGYGYGYGYEPGYAPAYVAFGGGWGGHGDDWHGGGGWRR
jgi:hypothetical protein